jgi:uncharacterized protein (TIGR02646 family)
MRGLTKGPPPTNVSPPAQEPTSLTQRDADYQVSVAAIPDAKARVKHARTCFDSMHKRHLRAPLFVEQRYLCIYCERQIDEAHPPPHIAHWNPLSLCPTEVFDWNNLHLSCLSLDTCDDRQKDQALNLPWPAHFAYEEVLGFTSGGRIYVRSDVPLPPPLRRALEIALEDQPGPPVARSTLNLNHPALREARAAVIESEEGAPPAQRQQRVDALLAKPRREDFISARLAALSGQLGVGR